MEPSFVAKCPSNTGLDHLGTSNQCCSPSPRAKSFNASMEARYQGSSYFLGSKFTFDAMVVHVSINRQGGPCVFTEKDENLGIWFNAISSTVGAPTCHVGGDPGLVVVSTEDLQHVQDDFEGMIESVSNHNQKPSKD